MSYPNQSGDYHDQSWPSQPPGYPPPPAYPASAPPGYYPPPQATNGLAIAALVCAIAGVGTCITAPIGAILGHVARRQIRERGEAGDGMALAGIIVGWILTGLFALLIVFYIVVVVIAINAEAGTLTAPVG